MPPENSAVLQPGTFPSNPVDLADRDGVIQFTASIKGNHYGMARLIYHAPLIMGRNARYRVNSVKGNTYDLTLTAGLSGHTKIFQMFPFSTKYGGDRNSGRRWLRRKSCEQEQESVDHFATPQRPGKES